MTAAAQQYSSTAASLLQRHRISALVITIVATFSRALAFTVAALAIALPAELQAQRPRTVMDAGVAHIPHLSSANFATSVAIQTELFELSAFRVISGLGGTFNLQDRSRPFGTGTRRTDIGTARLGIESRPLSLGSTQFFASASLAGSWHWYQYGGSASQSGNVNGGGWVSGIYGVRAQFGAPNVPGISLRYEIRPRFGDLASFNPYLGLGVAF